MRARVDLMKSMEKLDILREAGVESKQAEAIIRTQEASEYVTKDYLDARLGVTESQFDARISRLLNDITWRLIGLAIIVITAIGLLDKFVRP
jgi:hypothetical protein